VERKGSTRDRILDAAAHVMRTRGLARSTTKEIAREAGYSEAALYKHFRDKTDLFLAVLDERAPGGLLPLLSKLQPSGIEATVERNLTDVARAAIIFYRHNFPIAASLFSDPALLGAHRDALAVRDAGPHVPSDELATYLAVEQAAGGISPDVDPGAAAALLLGACLQFAFLSHFADQEYDERAAGDFAGQLAKTLVRGVADHRNG